MSEVSLGVKLDVRLDVKLDVRLDVWLWAARFYKTRSLCKVAVDNGHIRVNDELAKPSKLVTVGMRIRIKRGHELCVVTVLALADVRRGAAEAQQLYLETADSCAEREQLKLARQSAEGLVSAARPNKKLRRSVIRFKRAEP